MYRKVCRSDGRRFRLSVSRVIVLLSTIVPLFGVAFWLLSFRVEPVSAFIADWIALGWPYSGPGTPGIAETISFTNVDGTGVDIDVSFTDFTWDDESPYIYGALAAVPPLADSLRWSNNGADMGGTPGNADGPTYMEVVFSEPVYLDAFTVGSLSRLNGPIRYEWAVVTAFDESDNPVLATNFITRTHDVDAAGNYTGEVIVPGSPDLIDAGGGEYRARGVSLQGNCDTGCGYDLVTFVYDVNPVTRIRVVQIATLGTDFADPIASQQTSIVLEPIEFRPAGPTLLSAPAAIGNYVWLDEDADGRQDTGEPGIPNVLVELRDSSSNVFTTTTDADGGYRFGSLTADTYIVTIPAVNSSPGSPLDGMTQSTNPILSGADFGNQTLPYTIILGAGDENLTADFGYVWNPNDVNNNTNNAALGDRIWVDVNGDGVQDPSEIGLEGVTVNLIGPGADGRFNTGDDVTLNTDVTDANGRYQFTNLPSGAYVVRVDDTTLPAGYTQTGDPDQFGQLAGSPDHRTTDPVVLAPGDVFLNVDFGYDPGTTPVGRIGDLVWFDADASGAAEPMEPDEYGIAGVSVVLIQDSNGDGVCNPGNGSEPILARDVTDANGRYLFDGLPLDDGDGDADYLVWVNDTDNVLAALTQTYDDNDIVTPNCSVTALDSLTTEDLDQDFSYTALNHTNGDGLIGDTIWLDKDGVGGQGTDEPGIEGVLVTLTLSDTTSLNTTTDENGRYTFGGLDPIQTYTVTINATNFAPGGVLENLNNTADPDGGTPDESVVMLPVSGPIDLLQDFGYTAAPGQTACIGNLIWLDPNADGLYAGPDGPDGTPGTDDDETVIGDVTVDLYRDLNDDNDLDPGEPKMGTAVTLGTRSENGCFTTGDFGNYLFDELPAGTYIVDVTDADNVLAGYWHSRGSDGLTNNSQADPYAVDVTAGTDNLTADFGYYVQPAALGNRAWLDIDGDGLQDSSEPGLAGVEVMLTIEFPDMSVVTLRTTTDSSGIYRFDNLLLDEDYNGDGSGPEPTYTISAQTPSGFLTTATDVNGNLNDLEDADDPAGVTAVPVQGLTDTSALAPPTNEPTIASYDFGWVTDNTLYSMLGNYVWLDEDADGRQDAGEPGIPNVVVNLTDAGSNVLTTVTDADGGYLFDRLTAGDYTVTIPAQNFGAGAPLAGMTQTLNAVLPGADFGNQTLPYVITLGTGDENLTADFGYIWNPNDVNNNTNNAVLGDRVWVDNDSDGVQEPDEVGLAGVTVNLINPGADGRFGTPDDVIQSSAVTDETGRYSFPNLPPGPYRVVVDDTTLPAGYTQTGDPDSYGQPASNPDHQTTNPVLLGPGDVFLNADFGYNPGAAPVGTIGDAVWFDADASGTTTLDGDEYGIPGVTVVLIQDVNENGCADVGDGTEPIIARAVTDANGIYQFDDLPLDDGDGDADYMVWVNDTDNVLGSLRQTYDADGLGTRNCSATALDGGTPADLNQDFSYTPLGHLNSLGAIGDTVWLDKNGDAVQDAGEPGIEGVLVVLDLPGGITRTTQTDENGRYSFGGLNPTDTFTVTIDATNFNPGGVLENLGITADPDGGSDHQSVITLSPGAAVNLLQDFGYAPGLAQAACIGNLVWLDSNADGVFDLPDGPDGLAGTDDDEPVIGNVTVDLYRDLNGNGMLDAGEPKMGTAVTGGITSNNGCVTSGDFGNYIFDDLPAGDYIIDVSDRNNELAGYWHSRGADDVTNNSQADPYAISVAANNDNLRADFGYYVEPAALGNKVWFDVDDDGLQDSSEPGLEDVVVTLVVVYPDLTAVTLRTTTDSSGAYQFNNLLLDEDYGDGSGAQPVYTISVQTPMGFQATLIDVNSNLNDLEDADDPMGVTAVPVQGLTDASAQTAPTDEPTIASYDFGFRADTSILSAIGNLVWLDENSDGLQDPGEPGIPNVTVNLQDISGSVISTTVTDAHGGYLFPRLTGGVYTVTLTGSTLPAGLSQSTNAVLPNADFGNQTLPYPIILGAGDENLTADFGFIWNPDDVNNNTGLAALGDCVWFDADTDGIRDPDEAGVANVLLNLLGPGADNLFGTGDDVLLDTARTDAACRYAFTDLPAGAYQVQVDSSNFNPGEALAGTVQTADPDNYGQIPISPDNLTTTPVVLGPGDVFLNADFGYRPVACGSIGDTVWFDANADTVDAGEYGIDGVTVALIADSNGNGTWDGGEPIMATDVTTAGGQYLFPCLPLDDGDGDADYLVWVNDTNNVLSGLAQTFDADGTATGNISATALDGVILTDDPTQDFSYTPVGHTGADGLVGDTIYLDINVNGTQDAGEPALEGILVQLEMPGGNMLTTVTDENGRYTFGSLDPAGMYTITVDTTGFLSGLNNSGDPDTPGAPDSRSIVNLSGSGPVDLDQDFGYGNSAANTGGVGNLVWVDTNGDGVFAGEDGPDGTPGTDDDEPVLGGVTVDLYFDGDGNGRLDPNEPRISSGITAGTIDDVTYGTNGIYLFSGLPPGNYVADVSDRDGVLPGYWHSLGTFGSDDNSQSDPNALVVTANSNSLTADFGYFVEPAALGNIVWEDVDGNGIQDGAELPLPGVTVTLQISYPGGTIITLSTVSDANGYAFGNLLLDEDFNGDGSGAEPTYSISVQRPVDYVPTQTDVNSNGNDREDADDPFGVAAQPVQGITDTTPQPDPNNDGDQATIDFGFHSPLRVGNRVWLDLDDNSLFDPGETGIAGVVLSLLDQNENPVIDLRTGLPITAVTGVTGAYAFPAVSAGNYIVRVESSNFDEPGDVLYGFLSSDSDIADPVTDPDDGQDDDDDGVNSLNPVPAGIQSLVLDVFPALEPTGETDEDGLFADGDSNLTVDFGFFEQLTLGNRVWFDADNDGSISPIEVGVGPGLVMELLDVNGAPLPDPLTGLPITGTTDADGFYQFSYLFPGEYRVRIAVVNFQPGGLLVGFVSSSGSVDPDDDQDNDDNGSDATDPAVAGIVSEAITLAYDTEPAGNMDGDNNDNTNLTIDFGVLLNPTAVTLVSFTATDVGGKRVRVEWETVQEIDNFAFRLYRSQANDFSSAEHVYTEYAVHPNGATYRYLDTVGDAGVWYYWLEDVETDGNAAVHGPLLVNVSAQYRLFIPMVSNAP